MAGCQYVAVRKFSFGDHPRAEGIPVSIRRGQQSPRRCADISVQDRAHVRDYATDRWANAPAP